MVFEEGYYHRLLNTMTIVSHPLVKQSDYVRGLYISMLFSVAQADGEVNDAEIEYVKKLVLGLGETDDFDRYLKRFYEDFEGLLSAFVTDFQETTILYNFLVDALMISRIDGELNEKEIEFLASLSAACKLGELEYDFLTSFSLALIEEDEKKLISLFLLRPKAVSFGDFLTYISFPKTDLVENYINRVLELTSPLNRAKRLTENLLQKKLNNVDLINRLNDEVNPFIEEVDSELDLLEDEVKDLTKGWIEISDEHEEWFLRQQIWEIGGISDHLFTDLAGYELLGEVMETKPAVQLQQLLKHIDLIIAYIEDLNCLITEK